ncbi:hypothetical protein AURDEDRAFT_130734 [Auricularia subglabra TFB-10046 SS5]|uniref:Extracellular membrane protein CFEM domain-containing protein n=1 Tax=Auricularia subglabra (strain TFB-10046 / SS5) TaxID=717982 RepID=J0LEI1_AURST|nr:hypothetical protein AURDEDRAFT_130734 [Auricularia subglabra TFB-10046 SS5]
MRALLLLFFLVGSLALPQPQQSGGSSISFPDVQLSPAAQTNCIASCSQDVADFKQEEFDDCASATGQPARCLCTDATLAEQMQLCFGSRCPPLKGRCAAIVGGSSFLSGTSSTGTSGTSGSTGATGGTSVSFPDVDLSPAAQTACVQRCSQDTASANADLVRSCASATGRPAAQCLCSDRTLSAGMARCFAAVCPPLRGRCAAILNGTVFSAGTSGTSSSGSSSPGTSSSGTASPGTSSSGTVSPGAPGSSSPGTSSSGTAGGSSPGGVSSPGAAGAPPNAGAAGPAGTGNAGAAPPAGTNPVSGSSTAPPPAGEDNGAEDLANGTESPANSARGAGVALPLAIGLAFACML